MFSNNIFSNILIKEKSFYRTFFRMTIIIALQNCIVYGVNLADSIMLGNYSEAALSGATISNQVQFLLQMLTLGVGEGIVVLCSQYWGKKYISPIQSIISIGIKFGALLSFLLFCVVYFFPRDVLLLFTNKEPAIAEGVEYIKVVCFSYIFFCISNILISALRSVEIVKIGLITAVIALVINVILNYMFIFGNFGAPEMGSAGAALATVISRIIELCIMLFYIFFIDDRIQFKLKHIFKHNNSLFIDYIKSGLPIILSNSMWAIGNGAQMAILGRLEDEVIAAASIAATVFQILTVIVYGSASASGVMIGKSVGKSKISEVKQYTKTFQILFILLGIFTSVVIYFSNNMILSIYDISTATQDLSRQFITILSITVIGTAYQMSVLTGIVRGGGDTKFVMYNDTIFIWLIVIPSAALAAFVFHASPVIVFICLKCDQILKCIPAVIHVNRYKWIKKLTRENTAI